MFYESFPCRAIDCPPLKSARRAEPSTVDADGTWSRHAAEAPLEEKPCQARWLTPEKEGSLVVKDVSPNKTAVELF